MRCSLASILFMSACYSVFAQSDSTFVRPPWFVSLHSGALAGTVGNGTTASVSATAGVRMRRLSLGVGAGYDTYLEWKTLPVFTALSYDVIRRPDHSFFVQVNGGFSKAWSRQRPEEMRYESEGGFFLHPLVGYRLHQDKFTFYFSAGYKMQRLTYEDFAGWWRWSQPPGIRRTIVRDMERLSVSVGLGLW